MNVTLPTTRPVRAGFVRGQQRAQQGIVLGTVFGVPLLLTSWLLFPPATPELVGEWVGRWGDAELRLLLLPDGGCVLREEVGDQLSISHGKYTVDWGKRPLPLRLSKLTGSDHAHYTIARLRGDVLEVSAASPVRKLQPVAFSPSQVVRFERRGG